MRSRCSKVRLDVGPVDDYAAPPSDQTPAQQASGGGSDEPLKPAKPPAANKRDQSSWAIHIFAGPKDKKWNT
jgi:hypothetical protein